jgi:[ribosomal protein S5]-alanine N-acetyltransferase
MNLVLETKRLTLRPLTFSDAEAMYKMDNNPNVHNYLGKKPIQTIEECQDYIGQIRNQYIKNKIGRFAVVLKETNEVIGWAGLKFITEPENELVNFYDIGYRLQEEHWGNGYAQEAAKAWLDYGFFKLKKGTIYASAHVDNRNSRRILEKIGMQLKSEYMWQDIPCVWFELHKYDYNK